MGSLKAAILQPCTNFAKISRANLRKMIDIVLFSSEGTSEEKTKSLKGQSARSDWWISIPFRCKKAVM